MDDPTPHAQDCIDAVLDSTDAAGRLADDIGYTPDEVYATALAAAILGFNETGGSRASGWDLLYEVETAVAARRLIVDGTQVAV